MILGFRKDLQLVTMWSEPGLSQCLHYGVVTQSGSSWGTERSCHLCIGDDSPSCAPCTDADIGSAVENYLALLVKG